MSHVSCTVNNFLIFFLMQIRPASDSTSKATELKNTFSNDGSFLDQFKEIQQKNEKNQDISKMTLERSKSLVSERAKQISQQISNETKSHKDILSTPPPPPPSIDGADRKEISGTSDKSKIYITYTK